MPQLLPLFWSQGERQISLGQLVLNEDPTRAETMAFRYDESWRNSGFALGGDLPLTSSVLYPINDASESDPVLMSRNGVFGFYADHAPGKWVPKLLRQADLNGIKIDFVESTPASSQIWMGCGHVLGRFSALSLPVTHGFHTTFSPPLIEFDPNGKPTKAVKNLTSALEALHSGVSFRGSELLEPLLRGAMELGGNIPKCVVKLDRSKTQWVVRHSSVREPYRSALWMAVTRDLAQACGLSVVEGKLLGPRLYAEGRFDRSSDGSALLCLSAASLVRREKTRERILRPSPMTYLDIADILNRTGANPSADLRELFSRLLFNALTGNNRDRLDQFWFTPSEMGWRLLPMYSPCAQPPILSARFLSTPIRPGLNLADADAAISVSRYFGVSAREAKNMRLEFMHAFSGWRKLAEHYGADLLEIRQMQGVFG